ncbi:MAG TPA: glucosyl-3-phosphoglycerate synthase, partial [Acidimicrobiales bacterium]|nr:glucosyl-3-phosphoglycerate synthase [Acidimicrobiales bacterium]
MTGRLRRFHHRDFLAEDLVPAKTGRFVTVCLPARDEATTIGPIVATIRRELVDRAPLVDEILVVDDGSIDGTAAVAADEGATVVAASDVLPGCGPGQGKGEALWKALGAAKGDLLAFCDADVRDFDAAFVTGLLGPLLTLPEVAFVKGFYERPLAGVVGEGGRVTELVARPVLALLFPQLAGVVQPLAGEFAGRREVLEQVPFVQGYGVDLGLLIDVSAVAGDGALAQVDLGTRTHRNRPLAELSLQAAAVLGTALGRAGVAPATEPAMLVRPGFDPQP